MPGITRVVTDTAGGQIISTPDNDFCTVEGQFWAQKDAVIASHGSSPHDAATVIVGSDFVTINGKQACFAGNVASCGHVTTGSSFMAISS